MQLFELLNHETFDYLSVLNQQADLSRVVDTIESTETPDVARYLPKNTFLITTAMAYQNNQAGLCALIESLDALPCAGLAIKIGRFISTLDKSVIDTADRLGFPLLQIPASNTLGSVFQQLLAYVWNDQNSELNLALNTQKKFSGLILQGASTKAMLNNLGFVLKKPLVLVNPFGDVIDTNHSCTEENAQMAKSLFDELNLYQKPSGRIQYTPQGTGDAADTIAIYPITMVGHSAYYLFIFNAGDLSKALSTLVVEHVLSIFGFSLYKNLYVIANHLKNWEEYLALLLSGQQKEPWAVRHILTMGEKYNIKEAPSYNIVIGAFDMQGVAKFNFDDFSYLEERYLLIYNYISKDLKQNFHQKVVLFPETQNFRYIFLLQGPCKGMEKCLAQYHATFLKLLNVKMTFSFGNRMSSIDAIHISYKSALESYNTDHEEADTPVIRHYKPKDAAELLRMIPKDQIEGFCLYNLKTLAYPTDESTLELQKTLKTYLDCRCSMTETANKMFLHRNTIKYRIKKCEDILEKPIEDPQFCFQLQLSLAFLGNH